MRPIVMLCCCCLLLLTVQLQFYSSLCYECCCLLLLTVQLPFYSSYRLTHSRIQSTITVVVAYALCIMPVASCLLQPSVLALQYLGTSTRSRRQTMHVYHSPTVPVRVHSSSACHCHVCGIILCLYVQ